MSLLQWLQQADYQTTAFRGDADCCYAYLIQQALKLRDAAPALQGQSVAIAFDNLLDFTIALLAFDGWCKALYLLADNDTEIPHQVVRWPLARNTTLSHTLNDGSELSLATAWHLATSGTTGKPKWITHSIASLTRAIKRSTAFTELTWALCYQPTRFAGLQVLLQSLLSGATITDCSYGEPEQRIKRMQQHDINAISATPSLWRQLLMTDKLNTLTLKQLTLGGEIADQPLLDTLAALFPTARLLHIYASTEAGAGFAISDKLAGFPASWLHQNHSGLAFKIDHEQHLWLKPTHLPDQRLAALLDAEGYLDTGDLVTVEGERIHFLGRASGVINVGGNKVHPEQIEQVLLQHPAVLQSKVYAKASSVLGQLVVTDIVADDSVDPKALQLELITLCQQKLQRFQIPTRFHFVSTLATNATGKLSRQNGEKG